MSNQETDDLIYDMAKEDGQYAIAYALLQVAYQLKYLGNGNAATQMGAIEALGKVLEEGMARIADSIPKPY